MLGLGVCQTAAGFSLFGSRAVLPKTFAATGTPSEEQPGLLKRLGRKLRILNPLSYRDFGVGDELKNGIAQFYDESTAIWEEVWGSHLHTGFYYTGKESDHVKAQVDMIEEALKFAGADQVKKAVDVGCGIGGSARYIARKYGASVKGITLSPFQRGRAEALATKEGLGDKAQFQVADALQMPFEDNSFDLVWSMESGEHMPDKKQFISELKRVATPGGKIVVVTWCHRDLKPGEDLTRVEKALLKFINSIYFLPPWVSVDDYVKLANEAGLQNVRRADWTENVTPFWPAVLKSSLKWRSIKALAKSRTVRRGALAILYMIAGYAIGLIRFGAVAAEKPE